MDGLAAVSARVGEIESRIAALRRSPTAGAITTAAPTFADALSRAQASQTPVAAPGGVTRVAGSGQLTTSGAPVELARFGNGRIPADQLVAVGDGGHALWAPAAEAFSRLAEAARRDGVSIKVTDSYRSFDAQVDVAARKGLYSQGGLAAVPGTSDHGWGRSVDLSLDAAAQQWMRTNGPRYGFVEDVPREPWHWTYSAPTTAHP